MSESPTDEQARSQRIRLLFDRAMSMALEQRERFVRDAGGDDADEVLGMLRHAARSGDHDHPVASSVEQALALPDPEDAVDALADPLWHRVTEDWNDLSPAERTLFGIWCLKVEVCNGGFAQFLYNSTAAAGPEIVGALIRVGAQDSAKLLQAALAILGMDTSLTDYHARQTRVDSLQAEERSTLAELDDRFYDQLPDTMQRTRDFAGDHRCEFASATV